MALHSSNVYHNPNCHHISGKSLNRMIWFHTREEARASGRRGCADCYSYDFSYGETGKWSSEDPTIQYWLEDEYRLGILEGKSIAKEEMEPKLEEKYWDGFGNALVLCVGITIGFLVIKSSIDSSRKNREQRAGTASGAAKVAKSSTSSRPLSSSIREFWYNNNVLYISFATGGTYCYYNVPGEVYAEMLAAPSVGRFFHERIRDVYPYTVLK